jgi:hypothetical protein
MVSRFRPLSVMAGSAPLSGATIRGVGVHLSSVASRVDSAARRSRRFSWYCWGFLFGVYGGILVFSLLGTLFAVVTTTTTAQGTSTTSTYPWWDLPASAILPVGLLVLAVREVVLGRREQRVLPTPTAEPDASPSWTETVQQCQRKITHAKNETEWSFVPLVLGLFGLVEFLASLAAVTVLVGTNPLVVLVAPLIAFVSLIGLWPLYRGVRNWIGPYQRLLDQQVGDLAHLEAEFFWRFAGAPPTP